jgi:hypothetical protein
MRAAAVTVVAVAGFTVVVADDTSDKGHCGGSDCGSDSNSNINSSGGGGNSDSGGDGDGDSNGSSNDGNNGGSGGGKHKGGNSDANNGDDNLTAAIDYSEAMLRVRWCVGTSSY